MNKDFDVLDVINVNKDDMIDSFINDKIVPSSIISPSDPLIEIESLDNEDYCFVEDDIPKVSNHSIFSKLFNIEKPKKSNLLEEYEKLGLYIRPYEPKHIVLNNTPQRRRATVPKNVSPPDTSKSVNSEKLPKELKHDVKNKTPVVNKRADIQNLYNAKYSKSVKNRDYQAHLASSYVYSQKREENRRKFEETYKRKAKKSYIIKEYAIAIAIGLIITRLIMVTFHPVLVSGSSMEPTYSNGNLLMCDNDFSSRMLQRGDVIVFTRSNKKYIKRLIALPGDSIEIVNKHLYVNGEDKPDLDFGDIEYSGILSEKTKVLGEDEYFCMGDNRNNSNDCRNFGPISFYNIDYIVIKKIF